MSEPDALTRAHAELEAEAILACAKHVAEQKRIADEWEFASRYMRVSVDELKRIYPAPPVVLFTQLPVRPERPWDRP